MTTVSTLVWTIAALVAVAHAAKFRAVWKKCPKVNNESCLKQVVPSVAKILANGKKEMGIVPIDPLRFDRMVLSQGSASPVNINLTFTDLNVFGASNLLLERSRVDWDKGHIEFDVDLVSGLKLEGDYVLKGNIMVLPVNGKGRANITFSSVAAKLMLKGSQRTKKGKKYLHLDEGAFTILPKAPPSLHFQGLLGNFGDNMNSFLNDNAADIVAEMNSTISASIGEGIRQIANQFFHRVPLTDIYTES